MFPKNLPLVIGHLLVEMLKATTPNKDNMLDVPREQLYEYLPIEDQ